MDGEPAQVIATPLAFSRMDAGSQIEAERLGIAQEGARAFDGGRRDSYLGQASCGKTQLRLLSMRDGEVPFDHQSESVETHLRAAAASLGIGRVEKG